MAKVNDSIVTEFVLLGLTDQPELQLFLFFLFLGIYVVTIVGNLLLMILIKLNPHLHTPMYFFLFNMSFIDLCYSSVTIPKMLMNFVSEKNSISYSGCMAQLYFFCVFVNSESLLLSAMAYDRYVAICYPLLYNIKMSSRICSFLVSGVFVMGLSVALAHTGCMLRLSFCAGNVINHYMCDIPPLLELSCTSTYVNELVVFVITGIELVVIGSAIFPSYALIFSTILRINSTSGRSKAFSTCSSHLTAIFLFFGSGIFVYLKPSSSKSMNQGKVSSVFYTIVIPMLNPMIYSLRNKDVKLAMQKTLRPRMIS
ncbi:olfactory receptor 8B8-like [Gracilinanus agilis]|uniref:olfactory receptor 8B8-like n=1 Tax=Gracilinanus agilis TaxID=191870 RepID=UPI001CFCA4CE|nr:olfactory receptor 8B8-like [Gracilinanus agilis]